MSVRLNYYSSKAMKTTLCVYGWCPKCRKMHFQPLHGVLDDSDLPHTCGECGGDIIWDEAEHHHFPKTEAKAKRKGLRLWPRDITPVEGFEFCLLGFSALLLLVIGGYFHFGISQWDSLWRWSYLGMTVILIGLAWLLCRRTMRRITEDLTRQTLEEGRQQGRYLQKKEIEMAPPQSEA